MLGHDGTYVVDILTSSVEVVETSAAAEGGNGAFFFLRRARTGGTGSSSKGFVLATLSREPDTSLRAMRGVALKYCK